MKRFSYKLICARRRWIIYVVLLLLACSLVNYETFSSFLQETVTRMQSRRKNVSYSHNDQHFIIDSVKKIMLTNTDESYFTKPFRNIAGILGSTSITKLKDLDNLDINSGILIDKITSNIFETMDSTSANVTNDSNQTCGSTAVIGNSCKNGSCLRLQLPRNLRTRIEQIVTPSHLQINHQLKMILKSMSDKVPGYYDFILVSGVSYSHFEEAQAMLYNVHKNVFPYLKNFTFIYYNLGLSTEQRTFMAKICKCHLVDFPFDLLPEFVSFLKCYAWKPLIVNAHISRANLLLWIDASIRFKKEPIKTIELLNRARLRGVQILRLKQSITLVTLTSMFHFFGDEACVYANFSVLFAGVVLFGNEIFVKRAILEPWAACAINRRCMCPRGEDMRKIRISCHNEAEKNHYGMCHRFDQSALSLILVKIYQDKLEYILAPMKDYLDVKRADKMKYPVENTTTSDWV